MQFISLSHTGYALKMTGSKIALWLKINSPLSTIKQSCKCFPHVSYSQYQLIAYN